MIDLWGILHFFAGPWIPPMAGSRPKLWNASAGRSPWLKRRVSEWRICVSAWRMLKPKCQSWRWPRTLDPLGILLVIKGCCITWGCKGVPQNTWMLFPACYWWYSYFGVDIVLFHCRLRKPWGVWFPRRIVGITFCWWACVPHPGNVSSHTSSWKVEDPDPDTSRKRHVWKMFRMFDGLWAFFMTVAWITFD